MGVYRLPEDIPVVSQNYIEKRGIFYIGGAYKENSSGTHYGSGQMYVEVLVPESIQSLYPVVFFHGAGQTGVNWLITPDGRPGWADYFLKQGYVVYLVDQPSRGRSVYHPEDGGSLRYMTTERVQAEPAGRLNKLAQIPVLLLTAEASYHRQYDHLTAAFLEQAGVPVEHVMLHEKGFCGNGHMFMMEKNSEDIAKFVLQWIDKKINQEG